MNARPILLINKRRYSFHWSCLVAPANGALRVMALVQQANDNGWQGRPA